MNFDGHLEFTTPSGARNFFPPTLFAMAMWLMFFVTNWNVHNRCGPQNWTKLQQGGSCGFDGSFEYAVVLSAGRVLSFGCLPQQGLNFLLFVFSCCLIMLRLWQFIWHLFGTLNILESNRPALRPSSSAYLSIATIQSVECMQPW